MTAKIKKVTVKNLFGFKNISWNLNENVDVLVGKNGLGKSTILRMIFAAATHKPLDELELCDSIILEYSDGSSITANSTNTKNSNKFKSVLESFINSDDFEQQLKSVVAQAKRKNSKVNVAENIKSEILKSIENENSINLKAFEFQAQRIKGSKEETKLDVEFISTINMSANSINKIQTSDGDVSTILDFEISSEIQRMISLKDSILTDRLIATLNQFFSETNKKAFFENQELFFTENDSTQKLAYKCLSSGERQIIYIFLKVLNATKTNALILMDEPEISLHLSWQKILLNQIKEINQDSQILLVTHSPAIVMDGWMDSFTEIKDISE